jgi:hypothetical protein
LLKDNIHINIEEQVAMFLHAVGHNQRFRCMQVPLLRSTETTSRYFQEVLYTVGELRGEMITPPSTAVPAKIQTAADGIPTLRFESLYCHRCNKIIKFNEN